MSLTVTEIAASNFSWTNIVSLTLSLVATVLTLFIVWYNRRLVEANERLAKSNEELVKINRDLVEANKRLYELAFEQDLLRRKEEHFSELKEHVILPLLFRDHVDRFSIYLFKDLITHHYPKLGEKLKDFAYTVLRYEELRNEITDKIIDKIVNFCRSHSIELEVQRYAIQDNLELIRLKNISIYTDRCGNEGYCTYLHGVRVYGPTHREAAEQAKTVLEMAFNEVYNDREIVDKLNKYHSLGCTIPQKRDALREELGKLLEIPPKALKLINNRMCPYMKGEESEEPTDEERKIAEVLLREIPEKRYSSSLP